MNKDEIQLAIEILHKITLERHDLNRLTLIQYVNKSLSVSQSVREVRKLIEINEELINLVKHEEMEILYPFSKNKTAAKAFGMLFLKGYYDWSKLSEDPYELLKMTERMLGDLETSLTYLRKNIAEKASSGQTFIESKQRRRHL
ncbi:MAG: hypothetical protein ACP5MI_05460 [Candidatus Kryptoniota bacterium]